MIIILNGYQFCPHCALWDLGNCHLKIFRPNKHINLLKVNPVPEQHREDVITQQTIRGNGKLRNIIDFRR